MEVAEKKENIAAGILGALLGGLVGGAAIILIGQLDIVSAFSGVILAFCTLKGYEHLGGKLGKQGILVCIAVMLAAPYLADRVSWSLAIVEEFQWQFGDAFRYVHEVVKEYQMEADYWKDLMILYGFTALGAIGIVTPFFNQKK